MPTTFEHLLDQLDELKTQFGPTSARRIASRLRRIARARVDDAESLIRLHELLLFVRAHPHDASILKQTDASLRDITSRISRLRESESDLSSLDHPEVSGIASTSVIDTFGYQIVQWLEQQHPTRVDIYWDWFEDENRLADIWPRFTALLAEDALVEANVPYREWMRNARGRKPELTWLLERFNQLAITESNKVEIYNAQKLYVRWRFGYRDSRTGQRLKRGKYFYHDGPMIQRRDVKFKEELLKPAPKLEKLSVADGRAAIDMARTASTIRYRELYGFTNGDPKSVCRTSIGRGVELFVITLPPAKRLPLRAYHSAMIYKNGVPIGYFEGLSLCERMESGFNLYYTFRDGETAWLYARTLHVMGHLTGVRSFALDPYQIGFENEEGIESGAFWFYRKLGFRSTSASIQELTDREEAKIRSGKNYRTSANTLRRLAEAPMILELDNHNRGDWDQFQVRNLGFTVQRLMVKKFDGDPTRIRAAALAAISKLPGLGIMSAAQIKGLADFGALLLLVPELEKWSGPDRELLSEILRAKAKGNEGRYLRLMQKHRPLRDAVIRIGSR